MRHKYLIVLCIFIFFISGCVSENSIKSTSKSIVTISLAKPKNFSGFEYIIDNFQQENPDILVRLTDMPNSSSERHGIYVSALSGKDSTVDIYWMEDLWMNEFIDYDYILNLNPYMNIDSEKYIKKSIDKFSKLGQIYALPFAFDISLLYYRKDLINEIPKTWDDIFEIVKNKNPENLAGIAIENNASDDMFFNLMEMNRAMGGDLKNSLITYKNILDSNLSRKNGKKECLLSFKTGDALFLRNWNSAFRVLNDDISSVRGAVGVTLLPGVNGDVTSSLLGGYGLAVNSNSKNIPQAVRFLEYMKSDNVQRELARGYGYMPVTKALYEDEMVLDSNPHFVGILSLIPKLQDRGSYTGTYKVVDVLNKYIQNKIDVDEAYAEIKNENIILIGYKNEEDMQ